MPHILAFEIDVESLLVVVGSITGRNLSVQHTFDIKLDDEDTNEEIGERLRRWLSTHGVNKCEGIGVVSRSNAEIREITVPPAPDNELPDLIRFKAKSDFGSFSENWALDFVPFSDDPEKPRQVLAAAITPEQVTQLTEICDAASVKLKHMVFRPYASVDLMRMRLIDGRCRVLVDETRDETDISLTRGRNLLATRTVRLPKSDGDQRINALIREVRRTMASLGSRLEGEAVSEIIISGENNEGLREMEVALADKLGVDTLLVEPFEYVIQDSGCETPGDPQNYTALLGALCQQVSDDSHTIDFLNPRRHVVERTDFSKYLRIGGIAAAALFLFALFGWWTLSSQASDLADLRQQLQNQRDKNESVDDPANNVNTLLAEVEPLDEFVCAVPNWLDELHQISSRLQTPDEVIVDKLDASLGRGVAKVKIKVRVDKEIEKQVNADLILRPYEVQSGRATKIDDETYDESLDYDLKMTYSTVHETKREVNRQAVQMLRKLSGQAAEPTEPTDE